MAIKAMNGVTSTNDIKMVGLADDKKDNICWFNFDKHNGKDKLWIIEYMKNNFFKDPDRANKIKVLQFYDNKTGQLIEDIR